MRLRLLVACTLFAFGCVENNLNVASTTVAVNPGLLDLGTAAPGSSVSGTRSISSVGLGALTVASLTVAGNDADAFVVDGDFGGTLLAKGDSLEVPIPFAPTSEGAWEADLTVQTDANSGVAAVEVHLRGFGASPRLVISPNAVDFGHVDPGPDVFQTVVLQCVSAVGATLLTAELSGDLEFYLVPVTTPALITSATTLELSVSFGPTDTAAREGVLTLTTDDPQTARVLIPVTANVCLGDAALDLDSDGYSGCAGDCDDADARAVPGGDERIDGTDNDCDGLVDEGTDAYDDDGFTERGGDCDDTTASTSPGAPEIPDGLDNDCDGDGYDEAAGDCDAADAAINPGATETPYDGIDQDCSGADLTDADGDGVSPDDGDCDDGGGAANRDGGRSLRVLGLGARRGAGCGAAERLARRGWSLSQKAAGPHRAAPSAACAAGSH